MGRVVLGIGEERIGRPPVLPAVRPVTTSSVVPIVLAPLALSAAFGAGYLLALDEGRTAEAPRAERPVIDASEDLGDGRAGLILRDVDGLAAVSVFAAFAEPLDPFASRLPPIGPSSGNLHSMFCSLHALSEKDFCAVKGQFGRSTPCSVKCFPL